jgi:hypothetical protein
MGRPGDLECFTVPEQKDLLPKPGRIADFFEHFRRCSRNLFPDIGVQRVNFSSCAAILRESFWAEVVFAHMSAAFELRAAAQYTTHNRVCRLEERPFR